MRVSRSGQLLAELEADQAGYRAQQDDAARFWNTARGPFAKNGQAVETASADGAKLMLDSAGRDVEFPDVTAGEVTRPEAGSIRIDVQREEAASISDRP